MPTPDDNLKPLVPDYEPAPTGDQRSLMGELISAQARIAVGCALGIFLLTRIAILFQSPQASLIEFLISGALSLVAVLLHVSVIALFVSRFQEAGRPGGRGVSKWKWSVLLIFCSAYATVGVINMIIFYRVRGG